MKTPLSGVWLSQWCSYHDCRTARFRTTKVLAQFEYLFPDLFVLCKVVHIIRGDRISRHRLDLVHRFDLWMRGIASAFCVCSLTFFGLGPPRIKQRAVRM